MTPPDSIHRARARAAVPTAAVAAALAIVLAACNPGPVPTAGPGGGTAGPSGVASGPPVPSAGGVREPDVISGRVTTETGMPVANARLRIVGYTGGSGLGQHIETVVAGADGTYRYAVPTGLYEVLGEGDLVFEGQTFLFSLDPADGSCEQQMSDQGIVKDFVLRLTGLQMCFDGVDPENYLFYHGAPIQLFSGLSTAAPHEIIEYRFEPVGAFADGRPGEAFTVQRTVAALSTSAGPLDQTWVLHDIPLARYVVSAALLAPDGTRLPLLVSTDSQPTPAQSVELAFAPRVIVGTPSVGYVMPSLTVAEGG